MLQSASSAVSSFPKELPFELLALEKAVRYQQWIAETIQPYLGKRILELGAGIGNMSRWFTHVERLILTEMDPHLLELLRLRIKAWPVNSARISVASLDLETQTLDLFAHENIDTIISFNVLEHIKDDLAVLKQSAQLLRQHRTPSKKRIITFIPAHPFAYGVMDKAVGHYRRYNQAMIKKLHQVAMPDARLSVKAFNFVGLWGWFMNGRILRKKSAGATFIGLFEKLCPLIQFLDKIVIDKMHVPLGQSLLVIQEFDSEPI
ncbi:MAG: Nodulation protein S [uncultured bacterium]|nr:MAG: Nodulation protein S [uncultured bacterium]